VIFQQKKESRQSTAMASTIEVLDATLPLGKKPSSFDAQIPLLIARQ
jgi:hypothetical protein